MTELSGGVIINSRGELLLIHRASSRLTQWEIPGGKVESGETLEQAAVREVLEETGAHIAVTRRLGDASFADNGRDWHYTWWLAHITAGTPRPNEAMFDAVAYFTWQELAAREDLSLNLQNFLVQFPAGVS